MADPTSSPSAERIPLHSTLAKPALYVFTGMYVMGTLGLLKSTLAGEGPGLVATGAAFLLGGMMLGKMLSLFQHVYMTRQGIELMRPPRVIPWSKVGDTFRIPLTGSGIPICCIGIRDRETWDLHFLGRDDFDRVVADSRKRLESPD